MSKDQQASKSPPSPSRCYLAFALRDELQIFAKEAEELRNKREAAIERVISQCDHDMEHMRELPSEDNGWLGYSRPWLICARCGLTEEGWGCGYKALKHAAYKDIPKISRSI
jgi:hypothetical protein